MLRRIVVAALLAGAVVVGIVAGWQFAVGILLLAALAFGIGYGTRVQMEASTRWSSALYGDDRDDANHWSRTGGKRKR